MFSLSSGPGILHDSRGFFSIFQFFEKVYFLEDCLGFKESPRHGWKRTVCVPPFCLPQITLEGGLRLGSEPVLGTCRELVLARYIPVLHINTHTDMMTELLVLED